MRAKLLQAITASHAALQSALISTISERYARQISLLITTTPPHELAAAQDRLKNEEAAELKNVFLIGARRLEAEQTAAKTAFQTTTRALRRSRTIRHRHERCHLAITTWRWQARSLPGRRFVSGIGRGTALPITRARHRQSEPEPGR